uniref:Uncharacterized protein n=1 Tax=Aegilops tauschii subsp. strangulata TaxID=200361 RepID=A0A453LPJ7_AEGTS
MAAAAGSYGKLDKSFKLAARSILTAFSREDLNNAFPSFTDAERERLYQMFIYVIKSLHGNIVVQLSRPSWFLLSSMMQIFKATLNT